MKQKIYPCLWFNGQAKEAAEFYCSIFNHSKIINENPMVVSFEIENKLIMGLNGGPMFKINPSISLFVSCQTNEEIESIWNKLIEGGSAMMSLGQYPWAEKYGWVVDKFKMTWQLMLVKNTNGISKISPNMLFVGKQYGNALEAMQHYTSIFPDSKILSQNIYEENEGSAAGTLKFGSFSILNETLTIMDGFGAHEFEFNEAVSFVVECETQDEIDNYWNKLTAGGSESQCGWLKDKFGVSWQIVPTILSQLMSDSEKAPQVIQAFMKMKKFDIKTLLNA